MGSQGAQLLLEVSERVRSLTQAYFSPDRPLHLSFTHLVCRSAIEGNHQGPPISGPLRALHTLSTPAVWVSIFTAGGLTPLPSGGSAVTLEL